MLSRCIVWIPMFAVDGTSGVTSLDFCCFRGYFWRIHAVSHTLRQFLFDYRVALLNQVITCFVSFLLVFALREAAFMYSMTRLTRYSTPLSLTVVGQVECISGFCGLDR